MKILKQLLAPYSTEQFLSEHWTQKAIHVPATNPQKFHPFFSWHTLNYLLNYHQMTEPDLRFSKKGQLWSQRDDMRDWGERLRQGATLIVNGVHHRVPSVAQLAAQLQNDMGYETHVNLYCSPPEQQGFDCHYDAHDVFILQIEGQKRWFVYRETVLYPTSNMPSSKECQPTEPPYLECVLNPGDLLYIPRGHWHYAIAHAQSSLHLTVGMEPHTGLDWLSWVANKYLQNDANWRQCLPVVSADGHNDLKQQVIGLKQQLIDTLEQPEVLDQYIEQLSYQHCPPLPVSLPAQMGADIFPNLMMTRFAWSRLHRLRVKQLSDQHYQIQVGAKQIDLKGLPETLATNLFDRDEFSLLDIADWAPDLDLEVDIAPLLKPLILEGVLQVEPDLRIGYHELTG